MTEGAALAIVRASQEKFDACYEIEMLVGRANDAAYVFELTVPPTYDEHTVAVRHRTHPDELALEDCLRRAIEEIDFPVHTGEPLAFELVIRGSPPAEVGDPIAALEVSE